ncbi:MAG: hypothetical protein EA379_00430 [Phycisphaerales bacterium]|nr:MAG: hypothetical protein EA379_00430 [Phycisphaerales bacterium]
MRTRDETPAGKAGRTMNTDRRKPTSDDPAVVVVNGEPLELSLNTGLTRPPNGGPAQRADPKNKRNGWRSAGHTDE